MLKWQNTPSLTLQKAIKFPLSNPKQIMVAMDILKSLDRISCRWVNDKIVSWNDYLAEELGKVEDLEE